MVRLRPASILPALLLLAFLTPSSVGHDDSGGRYPGIDTGVAGTYVGAASGLPLTASGGVVVTSPNAPFGPATAWGFSMNCDLEVGGDGSSEQPQDEAMVDGWVTAGQALDGTWDDGGYGGACHAGDYGLANYNTLGCPDDTARASDQALGGGVWIGAACDWLSSLPAGGVACGWDGLADDIDFGTGSPGVTFPSSGIATSGCSQADALAYVFVFDALAAKATLGTIWTA